MADEKATKAGQHEQPFNFQIVMARQSLNGTRAVHAVYVHT